eukprot:CAMPEP_0196719988 /NCGR_PEP_ID=MMETSP1091-20130531/2870_1 /TAXON_ID=302021 /ORGANISM="Rhodomonas sp., Strain CCMP768" /LENGTH=310 /DNA_ID=CAMNT_0042061089 /DNA_START=76 /DNA_END=1008 /DNA_ORIENTATION=+
MTLIAFTTLDVLVTSDATPVLELLSVHKNQMLHIDVPIQQLATTKVGDIVKGKMKAGNNGELAWTGAITADTTISPQQGCVTVRVISDKYIAPGTPVSGTVGDSGFMGTVVGSPNNQERVGNIERRLEALEPSANEKVNDMKRKLNKLKRKLFKLEGHKTVEQKMEELEKRVVELERRPPTTGGLNFAGNVAGFHFTGALGTRGIAPRIDKIDSRISAMEARPKPTDAAKPVEDKIDDLNERLDDLTDDDGTFTYKQEMAELEKRLCDLETKYGNGGGGDNSKWFGTEEYHGIVKKPERTKPYDMPAGRY